jgi:hypothetical protein
MLFPQKSQVAEVVGQMVYPAFSTLILFRAGFSANSSYFHLQKKIMAIRGSIDLRLRPLKLAFVVDANDAEQIKTAIQINTYLWGGMFNPIIPGYKRIPGCL